MGKVAIFLISLVGLLFLMLGIGFMVLPDTMAVAFVVQPISEQGLSSIRGDIGGLFLGMGFFALLGAWGARRRWLAVPVTLLLLIISGRLITLAVNGFSETGVRMLMVEAVLAVVLLLSIAVLPRERRIAQANRSKRLSALKIAFGVACVAVVIAVSILFQKQIGMAMVNRLATETMTANAAAGLPDGLHVVIVGSGAPLPDPRRAGPCTAVIAGENVYLVDAGPGSVRKFQLMKLKPESVKAILLTHFHSDHIGDLGELMLQRWAGGSMKQPLDVFGPAGVDSVVQGFNMAYSLDAKYRVLHHGPEVTPPEGAGGVALPFQFPHGKQDVVVIESGDLKVTAFEVDHTPVKPAVGYRFDYKGRSVVISGDTRPCPSLTEHSRNADILVQEVLQPDVTRVLKTISQKMQRDNTAHIIDDILKYHTTPDEAARIAREAHVRQLLFNHVLPPIPVSDLKPAFMGDVRKIFPGPVKLAEDGMLFSLPAGKKEILQKLLL